MLVGVLVFAAVGIGAAGYHVFDNLPWLDAALNATMILTGMGPVNPVVTPAAKSSPSYTRSSAACSS